MTRRRVCDTPDGITTKQMLDRLRGVSYRQFSSWLMNGVFRLTWGPRGSGHHAIILDWEADLIQQLVDEIAELDARMTAIRTGARWAELVDQLDSLPAADQSRAA